MKPEPPKPPNRKAPKVVELLPTGGRMPPCDLDAEAAVLSAIVLDPGRIDAVQAWLPQPVMFFSWANQRVYEALIEMDRLKQKVDIMTLAAKLQQKELLHDIGGPMYLGDIINATPAVAHVEDHAQLVRQAYDKRQVILCAQLTASEGYGDVGDVNAWRSDVAKRFADLADNTPSKTDDSLRAHLVEAFRELEYIQDHGRASDRITTGHRDLDQLLGGGYAPGTLTVLAARPGMGKTSLAMQHALTSASQGLDTVVFSLEMPAQQLATRLLCTDAGVNSSLVVAGKAHEQDFALLAQSASGMSSLRLWIDERAHLTTAEIRSRVRRQQRDATLDRRKLGLVVVDYLQLVTGDGDSREQEISSISRGLKAIAKEFHVPVLALSQLSRSVESRGDKRPLLSDLRESGAIEQDADNVLFIYREDYYSGDKPKNHVAEVIVAKHRAGATGQVPLRWTGHCTRFDDLDTAHDDADARRY